MLRKELIRRNGASAADARSWSDDRAFLMWSEGMGAIIIANELRVSIELRQRCCRPAHGFNVKC